MWVSETLLFLSSLRWMSVIITYTRIVQLSGLDRGVVKRFLLKDHAMNVLDLHMDDGSGHRCVSLIVH